MKNRMTILYSIMKSSNLINKLRNRLMNSLSVLLRYKNKSQDYLKRNLLEKKKFFNKPIVKESKRESLRSVRKSLKNSGKIWTIKIIFSIWQKTRALWIKMIAFTKILKVLSKMSLKQKNFKKNLNAKKYLNLSKSILKKQASNYLNECKTSSKSTKSTNKGSNK